MIAADAAAAGGADDGGERGRDEQRVAESPAGAETDDGFHVCAEAGQERERDDEAESDHRVRLAPIRLEIQLVKSIATPVMSR